MVIYSQRQSNLKDIKLGQGVTVGSHGCLLVSLSNLYQTPPEIILSGMHNISWNGEADTHRIAIKCGGEALPTTTKQPEGWCIAMTDYYKKVFPTHFFCLNTDTNEMIDPLVNPPKRETNRYNVIAYRPFTNIKLDFTEEDLKRRLFVAEQSVPRLAGMRKNSVLRFIDRVKHILGF